MDIHEALIPSLETLRRVYPDGVPATDYMPLLAILGEDMSHRSIAVVVAELIDGERVVVANDLAAALSEERPLPAARDRVRGLLTAAGWDWEEE